VAYTGTHDNDTTVGWFNSKAGSSSTRDAKQIKREREFCLNYLKSGRKGNPLGFYPNRLGIGGEHGDGADAGFARFGQRSPHESARFEFGKLVLAMQSRRFFRRDSGKIARIDGNLRKSLAANNTKRYERKVMKNRLPF
jgi:hypothetical protein